MTRITQRRQFAALLAALPTDDGHSLGRRPDDEVDYAWLDEEMMKVGSLRHAEVDWSGAETRAVRLLETVGKDHRVLGHLLHCLQHGGDALRFALSLHLLGEVLDAWWDDAWPFQGPRGGRARRRQFEQLTRRAAGLAGALDFGGAEDAREICREACRGVIARAETKQLPTDELLTLQRLLDDEAHPRAPGAPEAAASSGRERNGGDTPAAGEKDDTPRVPDARLESGNERGNRQALLKMADFLNEQSPGDPLGYRLRRHAIWQAIHALPGSRDGVRTELAPVAADRVAAYRDGLSRGADAPLWSRIEASLAVSPYWLGGHRLSAEAATALGHPRCAEAIREEVARFVARLPGIDALHFNDGTPFLDAATRDWLAAVPADKGAALGESGGEPWQAGLCEARERLAEEGLQAALERLDAGLAAARSPRDHAYWRLASAELLDEAGLVALAQQHYQALHRALADIDLTHWEPDLLARLEASLAI